MDVSKPVNPDVPTADDATPTRAVVRVRDDRAEGDRTALPINAAMHPQAFGKRRKHSTMGKVSCGMALLSALLALAVIPAKNYDFLLLLVLVLACGVIGLAIVGVISAVMGLFQRRRSPLLPLLGLVLNPAVAIGFLIYVTWPGADSLVNAAANNEFEAVERALNRGVDINAFDTLEDLDGNTFQGPALVGAAHAGHAEMADFLVIRGADVNLADGIGRTALFHAARLGHRNVVDVLLGHDADPNIAPPGVSALYHAAANGNQEMVAALLAHDADVSAGTDLPLIAAAAAGHSRIVDLLIAHDADVNARGGEAQVTALHQAAAHGHTHVVNRLLAHQADPNLRSDGGETPLHLAIWNEHERVIERLLNAGATIDLFAAIGLGDLRHVQRVLGEDRSQVSATMRRMTPLHYAARQGEVEIVKTLIAADADLGARAGGPGHATPLYLAVRHGNTAVAQLLLNHGADPNEMVDLGDVQAAPIYFAVVADHHDLVDVLLAAGADVNVNFTAGEHIGPPLLFAAVHGYFDVAGKLLAANAQVDGRKNPNRPTPLLAAVTRGDSNMVKLLIEHGADVRVRQGAKTPMNVVQERQRHNPDAYDQIFAALRNAGALDE